MFDFIFSEEEKEILSKASEILLSKIKKDVPYFTAPNLTSEYLRVKLISMERECFGCLYLDNRHKLIDDEILFYGTIDAASVYPREVVKSALHKNAAAVIFYHNHPSGDPTPSSADKHITIRLVAALELVQIRVLDHIIVGLESTTSFAEHGMI